MIKKKRSKINIFLYFLSIKKMSEKTLKFNDIRLNKKEFHKSKRPIDLMSVNIERINEEQCRTVEHQNSITGEQ